MDWGAVLMVTVVTAALATLSVLRYRAYNASMFDLGHMSQAIWSSTKGRSLEFSYRVVFSDYAEINFHAERRSIRSGAVINANWAMTGLLTAESLIDEMDANRAMLVLHHIGGGSPPPHHLVSLQDYREFREYLVHTYDYITTWDRAGQITEIWQRR